MKGVILEIPPASKQANKLICSLKKRMGLNITHIMQANVWSRRSKTAFHPTGPTKK